MLQVARETISAFDRRMEKVGVPLQERADFQKWVWFYLDFCQKYGHPARDTASLEPFLRKLEAKRQSAAQRAQATRAVRLLLAPPSQPTHKRSVGPARGSVKVQETETGLAARVPPAHVGVTAKATPQTQLPVSGANTALPAPGASWEREYQDLEAAIKMRNYSKKTFSAYRFWLHLPTYLREPSAAGQLRSADHSAVAGTQ